MPFSNWICTNNSKTMLLRIVHPGGHVELHNKPITAAEIMCRNPRCCVAYPYVFQQPWAIVAPDTVLMLGKKYYVVPISTIRKLQRLSPRNSPFHSPSPAPEIIFSPSVYEIRNVQSRKEEEDEGMISTCCIFRKKSTKKQSNNYNSKIESDKLEIRSDVRNLSPNVNDSNTQIRKRNRDLTGNGLRGSPKKAWSSEHWQPSLESITEE